jgi:DNA-directed RNA polymerase specialized sigma24 family protein
VEPDDCVRSQCRCHACLDRLQRLWSGRRCILDSLVRRGADTQTASDIATDAYVVAWRRLAVVPHEQGEAIAWLCAVAKRLLANHRRDLARIVLAGDAGTTQSSGGMDGVPAVTVERLLAIAAWNSLSAADRGVLYLQTVVGMTTDQIATELGCSPGAARTRLSRARRRLVANLGEG